MHVLTSIKVFYSQLKKIIENAENGTIVSK